MNSNKNEKLEDFNWQKYLELNPDLYYIIKNEKEAKEHYLKYGKIENRKYTDILVKENNSRIFILI
jgi:hypothetical protein